MGSRAAGGAGKGAAAAVTNRRSARGLTTAENRRQNSGAADGQPHLVGKNSTRREGRPGRAHTEQRARQILRPGLQKTKLVEAERAKSAVLIGPRASL